MESEHRKEPRFVYVHKVTIDKDRNVSRGKMLDISQGGMKLSTPVRFDDIKGFKVRFYLQKDEGLQQASTKLAREGQIQWLYFEEGTSFIGVKFDEPLPLEAADLDSYLSESDYCYVHIFHQAMEE